MSRNKIFSGIIFTFFIFSNYFSVGQDIQSFEKQEIVLQQNFEYLKTTNDDATKKFVAKTIDSLFVELLSDEKTFDTEFEKLKIYCSFLKSDDGKFRIITWNNFFSDGTFEYYGYCQFYNDKDEFIFVKLNDKSEEIRNPETENLSEKDWFGCLYYEIITTKHKKDYYYTLLGWDGNNSTSNKKIIEVVTIKNNNLKFGFPFEMYDKKSKRLIFEYNKQASMTLRWDENQKMIIFDHLAPEEPKYNGIYEFYGPDLTHDGLKFKKGKWLFKEEIYVENPKE